MTIYSVDISSLKQPTTESSPNTFGTICKEQSKIISEIVKFVKEKEDEEEMKHLDLFKWLSLLEKLELI